MLFNKTLLVVIFSKIVQQIVKISGFMSTFTTDKQYALQQVT